MIKFENEKKSTAASTPGVHITHLWRTGAETKAEILAEGMEVPVLKLYLTSLASPKKILPTHTIAFGVFILDP